MILRGVEIASSLLFLALKINGVRFSRALKFRCIGAYRSYIAGSEFALCADVVFCLYRMASFAQLIKCIDRSIVTVLPVGSVVIAGQLLYRLQTGWSIICYGDKVIVAVRINGDSNGEQRCRLAVPQYLAFHPDNLFVVSSMYSRCLFHLLILSGTVGSLCHEGIHSVHRVVWVIPALCAL